MATISVFQKTTPNKDGDHPVILRISHDYQRKFITLFSIPPDKWNNKKQRVRDTMPGAVNLNRIIDARISKYKDRIYVLEAKGKPYKAEDILKEQTQDLLTAVAEYRDKAKKEISHNAYAKYKVLHIKLSDYLDSDINLHAVDERFMDSFAAYLRSLPAISSENTVMKYLTQIKRVLRYNKVSTDALDVSTGYKKSLKVSLSKEELKTYRSANLPAGWYELAQDVFLMQVYLRGARIGDVLQLTHDNIKGDRILYTSQKNNKNFDIRLILEVKEIIDKYKGQSVYLLPVLQMRPDDPGENREYYQHINSKNVLINKYLGKGMKKAGIHKHVTTHCARHTFTRLAIEKGLDLSTMQHLLGHSSPQTTQNYMRDVMETGRLDDAVDDLF